MKILVIEDDRNTAEMIKDRLAAKSNLVEVANDGGDGSFLGKNYEYDAIVLDYSLPKKDGLMICREVRAAGRATPILFLSVTDDTNVKVSALNYGADDYMTKPFSMDELEARLQALMRRPAGLVQSVFKVDDLVLHAGKNTVTRGEKHIHMTRKEFCLLEYLMRHAGTILSRAMIMEHVWTADSDPFSNTVEAHIRNVRKKITVDGKPDLIANVPGRGYILDTPENLKA